MTNKILVFLLIIISINTACNNSKKDASKSEKSIAISNQEIQVHNFKTLEPLLYTNNKKTYLINFWAMWCGPCVKELPYIEQYAQNNPDVEILLVSLDFPEDIETKLKPFLKEKNIKSKVVLLDDSDANSWINKIDSNWSGAIPFTIIFDKDKRAYFEHSFASLNELESTINNFKTQKQ